MAFADYERAALFVMRRARHRYFDDKFNLYSSVARIPAKDKDVENSE